jgi:hypothetical protein
VRRSDDEEVELARVNALRHLQRHTNVAQLDFADVMQPLAHQHRCEARALGVSVAVEP